MDWKYYHFIVNHTSYTFNNFFYFRSKTFTKTINNLINIYFIIKILSAQNISAF